MSNINSPRGEGGSAPPPGFITQVTKEQAAQNNAIQIQTSKQPKKKPWLSIFGCCMVIGPEDNPNQFTPQHNNAPTINSSGSSSGSTIRLLKNPISEDVDRKTLVLDLDETLVHSSFKPITNADFIIPVEIEDTIHHVYVVKRPGVDQFMKYVGSRFETVVFTASLSKYADPVLDLLDIHKVVRQRLFREACVEHKGNFVKDLSRLGRPLSSTIIIDNSPMSYLFHPHNALPIGSWFDDPSDTELLDMLLFLDELSKCDDVVVTLQNKK